MDEAERHLHSVFEQTARVLERSADLADEHADRHESAGRADLAGSERKAGARARAAATRAQARADQLAAGAGR
jgi:hypothetical protein